MSDELVSAIDALVLFVKNNAYQDLDQAGVDELSRLDAQVFAWCQLAGVPIPEIAPSGSMSSRPFGHTRIPSGGVLCAWDQEGQEHPGAIHVYPTRNWEQAMLGLRLWAAQRSDGSPGTRGSEEWLKPSREKAYRLFQWAMEQNPNLKTDQEVYDWLNERSDLPD